MERTAPMTLQLKEVEELDFWKNLRKGNWRGFTPEEWRTAHIHFKQYSLMYINRDIGDLENRTVIEVGCGPAGVVPFLKNATAIGVEPLVEEYRKLWDLSNDNVEYICSEIESFEPDKKADVVICWNVLDHVSDIETATRKLHDMLKPDGELWLLINLKDYRGYWKIFKGSLELAHPFKVNIVSISRHMRKHGFFWKEKTILSNCISGQDTLLMGVLGKGQRPAWPAIVGDVFQLICLKINRLLTIMRNKYRSIAKT